LNLIAAAPLWLVLVLVCAMLAAAIEDAVRFRISNLTALVVLAGAIIAAVITGPTWSLWQNVVVFAAILLLGTFAFSAGWLGGGDVKLLAAAGLWFDLRSALWFLAAVFLSGGVVAICYLLARPFRRSPGGKMGRRVPYGVAIAVGALAMILLDHGNLSAQRHPESPLRNVKLGG
jgi:prepilin peptidase CpaA